MGWSRGVGVRRSRSRTIAGTQCGRGFCRAPALRRWRRRGSRSRRARRAPSTRRPGGRGASGANALRRGGPSLAPRATAAPAPSSLWRGAAPPATLAEFTLDGSGSNDFYDVSLVDGYNIPMLVAPQGGSGPNCRPTGCLADLNGVCPSDLKVVVGGEGVACRSACDAFGAPQYCCSGAYGSPSTCGPTSYSLFFKNACPRAYSYAYDDATSTFTCAAATASSYIITFCPSTSR
ncbi:Pathogenesis-related protein 5 [Ananas comosus]|uniref:Pathogenesis-related protein 5 n=1 Tax=Ananas comosus TaxID=4615 RepID=A0A199V8S0_ANACO|nr:Pathogenesis-related protein 5 [Ananas comosus]